MVIREICRKKDKIRMKNSWENLHFQLDENDQTDSSILGSLSYEHKNIRFLVSLWLLEHLLNCRQTHGI